MLSALLYFWRKNCETAGCAVGVKVQKALLEPNAFPCYIINEMGCEKMSDLDFERKHEEDL